MAGDQHRGGQVERQVFRLFGPAERAERHQRRRVPGVEHVLVAHQRPGVAGLLRLGAGLVLAAGDVHRAAFAVPGRNLVAPPQLPADAPVLDVVHPLVVGVDPLLRHEAHGAGLHGVDGFLRDRLARLVGLAHRHEPLVGQHRLDDLPGAGTARHHQLVLFRFHQQALRLQVGHDGLAGGEAVQPLVGGGRVVVDAGVEVQHADDRQPVALAHGVVVGVVRGRDLDHAGAEVLVHVVVGDHRDLAADQRQRHALADQVPVALVLGVHHHRHVAQHGLGPRGGHHQLLTRAVGQRVGDVPQKAVFLLALDFQVAHGGLQLRVPVDQALAAVDQALFVQPHKGFGDHLGQLLVHGEVLAAPVHRGAHAAHLPGDGVARLLFPVPHAGDEIFTAQRVPALALLLQLALHHDLRGDAGVVGARHPQRVVALHAVVARQAVHDGLVERVAHVQRAGHVGRRQLDGEVLAARRGLGAGLAAAAIAGAAQAGLLPRRAPLRLDGGGLEGFGQAGKTRLRKLFRHGGGRVQAAGLACGAAARRGTKAKP